MMLEFWIIDLQSDEKSFSMPGSVGVWDFNRFDNYDEMLNEIREVKCSSTYYASNSALTIRTSRRTLNAAFDDLINSCLILSFITAKCVTPYGPIISEASFPQMGESFLEPRAIYGFPRLNMTQSIADYFSRGMASLSVPFSSRQLRLFLSRWVSGLTCFSMEDLFLSIGVQMDIVKQCEIAATRRNLTYFGGMESASNRYSLKKLSQDYRNMRNDIVHEGVLSGSNFRNKRKAKCGAVIAECLNWIDQYVAAVLGIPVARTKRWRGRDIEFGLPSLTVSR